MDWKEQKKKEMQPMYNWLYETRHERCVWLFQIKFSMASRAKAKPPKKRQQRATSNIFAMFDQSQIQEYKEAFNIIDHDRV